MNKLLINKNNSNNNKIIGRIKLLLIFVFLLEFVFFIESPLFLLYRKIDSNSINQKNI